MLVDRGASFLRLLFYEVENARLAAKEWGKLRKDSFHRLRAHCSQLRTEYLNIPTIETIPLIKIFDHKGENNLVSRSGEISLEVFHYC